jgi:8-oxo-dGTP pyrophosphatase MutT (NUDIX family)
MSISEEYIGKSGVKYIFEYEDSDSFDGLDYEKCRQVYGVCFYGEQMVIGFGGQKQEWGLIGGTIEEGEKFEETLKREIQEESNMEVLSALPIGYQKVIDTRDGSYVYQLRYACKVKPHGPFVVDPAGGITEIKLINPEDYKQYFDWGKTGARVIGRALELKSRLG